MVTAMAKSESLPQPEGKPPLTRWFSSRGSVVRRGSTIEVFVGGTLIGAYEDGDQFERNAILVQLSEDPECHLGRLADAFELSSERLRQLRREYEKGGLAALSPGESGGQRRLSARDVVRLERLFAQGLRPQAAQSKVKRASLSTVARLFRAWRERGQAAKATVASESTGSAESRTLSLPGVEMLPTPSPSVEVSQAVPADTAGVRGGGGFVQHLGTWLMITFVARLGLYKAAEAVAVERACVPASVVRVGFDATIAAFALGEHALEGVRRLRTPTAKLLLQTPSVPSPDSLRALMDDLSADLGAVGLHFAMLRRYIKADRELKSGETGVFYVDNHMRPYTGKHVVRKGWRMQDKRVRPGVSDYYVHDEDGRPLFRIDVPSHGSLPIWMMPIVNQLRAVVGEDDRLLVAFDRGGAYPETMSTLRDEGCEFVTYERAPYPALPENAFTSEVVFGDEEDVHERLRFVESRTNLRKGRGRVRRIAVRDEDGHQINLLSSSTLSTERLIGIMRGRWQQENAFKHGKERWGINHLDARKVVPADPDEIMPNPARRRLDIARRAANVREGDARCVLARYDVEHPRHQRALRLVDAALDDERAIDALRPSVPKHARVADTELAGKLVRHDGRRKLLLDTVRIACANAESDLAQLLATNMTKPREAKKLLANLLRAPGRVRVSQSSISVDLAPASTSAEARAIAHFLRRLSRLALTLPGDPRRRPLRFRSQID
jgi:hypothetical protein